MTDSRATYVATCQPFIATDTLLRRRRLARQAKARRDPGTRVLTESLVRDIQSAILDFKPPSDLQLAAWFGTADRLAYVHPSGMLELLGGETQPKAGDAGCIDFVTVVGPRSYWPEAEARAYRSAVEAFTQGGRPIEDLAQAAKALVSAARRGEATWSPEEWLFRIMAAIAAWIFWDDEPGAAREV